MAVLKAVSGGDGAGQLDRRIVIESYTATRDALGGEVQTWATHATVWGGVIYKELQSDETQMAGSQVASKKVNFRIRYLSTVTEKMRVSFESEYYDILSITHEGRKRFTILEAERRK
jgi:SPP1 family predicted phage head-tail adaptor